MASTQTLPPPAPLDARFSAFLLDGGIVFVAIEPLLMWWILASSEFAWLIWGLSMLAFPSYFAAFWSLGHGQTPGMRVRRLRVVDENGRDLGLARAFGRAFVLLLGMGFGIIPLGLLLDGDRVPMHDRLFATRVIRTSG